MRPVMVRVVSDFVASNRALEPGVVSNFSLVTFISPQAQDALTSLDHLLDQSRVGVSLAHYVGQRGPNLEVLQVWPRFASNMAGRSLAEFSNHTNRKQRTRRFHRSLGFSLKRSRVSLKKPNPASVSPRKNFFRVSVRSKLPVVAIQHQYEIGGIEASTVTHRLA